MNALQFSFLNAPQVPVVGYAPGAACDSAPEFCLFRRRAKIDEQDFSRCELLFQNRVAAASVAIIACTVPVKTRPDRGSKMAGDKIGGAAVEHGRIEVLPLHGTDRTRHIAVTGDDVVAI
jgi:hypothetical protein